MVISDLKLTPELTGVTLKVVNRKLRHIHLKMNKFATYKSFCVKLTVKQNVALSVEREKMKSTAFHVIGS